MRSWIIAALGSLLLVIGVLFFVFNRPQPTPASATAWGGSTQTLQDPRAYTPSSPVGEAPTPTYGDAPSVPVARNTVTPAPITQATSAPFTSLVADLVKPSSNAVAPETSAEAFAQAFINNFGSLTTYAPTVRAPTPEQEALHAYGNAAATIIDAFIQSHTDQVDVLNALLKDRGSREKADAFRAIGTDMGAIGTQLRALSVPASAQLQHAALAQSYSDAGRLLSAIADAGTNDAQLLATMNAYNASVEQLNRNYVNLINLFALAEVTFSSEDAGSAFSYPGALF